MKKNVLIAGCGYVGAELASQLLATQTCHVWGLKRNPGNLPAGITPVRGDISSTETLGKWPERIDYMIFSASANEHTEAGYRAVYITGLKNILSHLVREGYQPARVFFTSSTSVYHQCEGEWVHEASPTEPATFSGKIMLQAEDLLHDAPFPSTVVRFGGIYGPGRNRLIQRVKEGRGCYKSPVVYGNRIHRDDCAGIVAHLIQQAEKNNTVSPVYIGVDNNPESMHTLFHWLAKEIDIKLDDNYKTPARGNRRCSNHLIRQSGYTFKYPDYKAGYKEELRLC